MKLPFRILTAYEDSAASERANDMWVRLAIELKPRLEIANDVWKFELLNHPQLREFAAAEAIEADLIVISAHGEAELSAHVGAWLENWLTRRSRRTFALVALLSKTLTRPGIPPRLGEWLRQVAKTGHLDFFCKTGDWAQTEFEYYIDVFPHRSEIRSAVLAELLNLELRSRSSRNQSAAVPAKGARRTQRRSWANLPQNPTLSAVK